MVYLNSSVCGCSATAAVSEGLWFTVKEIMDSRQYAGQIQRTFLVSYPSLQKHTAIRVHHAICHRISTPQLAE